MTQYTKEWVKEYNKTWYYKITLPSAKCPDNWISGRIIKPLGFKLVLWKCAKPNYKWNN